MAIHHGDSFHVLGYKSRRISCSQIVRPFKAEPKRQVSGAGLIWGWSLRPIAWNSAEAEWTLTISPPKKSVKYFQIAIIDDTQYIFSGFWLFYLFWGCYKGWLFWCLQLCLDPSLLTRGTILWRHQPRRVLTHGRLPSVDNVSCLIHRIYRGYSPAKLAEADISFQIQRHMIKWLGNKAQNFNRCTKHSTLILFWSPSCWTVQLTPSISKQMRKSRWRSRFKPTCSPLVIHWGRDRNVA